MMINLLPDFSLFELFALLQKYRLSLFSMFWCNSKVSSHHVEDWLIKKGEERTCPRDLTAENRSGGVGPQSGI